MPGVLVVPAVPVSSVGMRIDRVVVMRRVPRVMLMPVMISGHMALPSESGSLDALDRRCHTK
jgi:hypothetical protein